MTAKFGPASPAPSAYQSRLQEAEQLFRKGRFADSEDACRKLTALDPRQAAGFLLLGLVLVQRKDYDGAERAFRSSIEANPRAVGALTNLGNLQLLNLKSAAAESTYRQALAVSPQHPESLFNLGLALKAQKKFPESLEVLRKAVKFKSDYIDAYVQLGVVLLTVDDAVGALEAFDRALSIRENHFEAHFNRGIALVRLGRLEEAKLSLARAASMNERSCAVFLALGQTLHRLKEMALATSALARAAALEPDNKEAHAALAAVFLEDGWTVAALDEVEKSLKLDPDYSFGLIVYGQVLSELNRLDESIAAHERAVAIAPQSVEALTALGTSYLSRGRTDDARNSFLKAKSIRPDDIRVFLNLARTDRFTTKDPRFQELEAKIAKEQDLTPNERIELHFTAGRVLDDAGDFPRAFHHFAMANKLQSERSIPKEEEQIALQERIKEIFSRDFVSERLSWGFETRLPIFVLGMPRSGTTLCEQIISSHPAVSGAGEVLDMEIAIKILSNRHAFKTPMPGLVELFSRETFRELGETYASRLAQRAPGASHITDKLPGNFNRVGLIRLALPQAKIIHCIRNPMDCCFSIYSNHFVEHLEHANDLERLGRFYRRYHDLMGHWRDVLPDGSFLDLRYEDTVRDLEGTARRIIAHCGLEWDPRCLDFQNNKRQVVTLSITQVRQPIYTSSIERWRNYEKELEPLREALGELAEYT